MFESISRLWKSIVDAVKKIDFQEVKKRCSSGYIKDLLWEIKYKLSNIKETNYDLGLYHITQENYKDAAFRFKWLEWWNRGPFKNSSYYIGLAYYKIKKYKKAEKYLDSYLLSKFCSHPFNKDAKAMIKEMSKTQ